MMRRLFESDDGAGVVSVVLIIPVVVMFAQLIVFGGRVAAASADVHAAAREAARTASIAVGSSTAANNIQAAAMEVLDDRGLLCVSPLIELTQNDWRDPGDRGSAADEGPVVEVTVTCQVQVSDLTLIPVPASGSVDISASALEPIDVLRARVPR